MNLKLRNELEEKDQVSFLGGEAVIIMTDDIFKWI